MNHPWVSGKLVMNKSKSYMPSIMIMTIRSAATPEKVPVRLKEYSQMSHGRWRLQTKHMSAAIKTDEDDLELPGSNGGC